MTPEGFGAKSLGGEGGEVLWVANLADRGAGSLREALAARTPRVVKFKVGGVVDLESPLIVRENGRLTIDGASAAAYGGITIRGYGLQFEDCEDIVVTHVRQRRARIGRGGDGGCFGLLRCKRVLFDHCSAAWSTDENFGAFRVEDVTFQWCISAEGLIEGGHPKGAHSMGLIVHRARGVTIHHCLFASNVARNPRWKGNWGLPWAGEGPPPDLPSGLDEQGVRVYPVFDIRNNVFYNYVSGGYVDFVPRTNFVGNLYKAGPSTPPGAPELVVARPHPDFGHAKLFVSGNLGPHRPNDRLDPWALVKIAGQDRFGSISEVLSTEPFATPPVRTQPAAEGCELVLRQAGARPIDATDRRSIRDVREGKGKAGRRGTS
jgi:pectate lyase